MNKMGLVIGILVLVSLTVAGCVEKDRADTYAGDPLLGNWESHGLCLDVYADGTGNLEYKGVSTDFEWERVSNDTIIISHLIFGSHTIQYEVESENSILLTYEGDTYRLEKI